MIAAIYARKSTEQHVADEQKSVARQIAHAREYATRKAWTVDERYIYVDDGISGAEFAKRPGFMRLMTALKPAPPFQRLIMSEEARLGREMAEVLYALKQLVAAGVRVFLYLDDRERTLDSPIDKLMLAAQAMSDEMEREKARQRAHDKARQLARAGHVAGGRCFGYDNVPVAGTNGERSHVEYRVNEEQAVVVRRIFKLKAIGYGQHAIAKMLNAEGAAAPRSQQGRPRAWVASSVHAVLFRDRYRGEPVWNKTQKCDHWGQHHVTDRPADQWEPVTAPDQRIVSEELWQAAHAKLAMARSSMNLYRGRRAGSKYLLPGLARCAWCNGGMYVRVRTRSWGQIPFYACASHFARGESVCRNFHLAPMDQVDDKVLACIGQILTPDFVDEVVASVRADFEAEAAADPRTPLEAELASLDAQLEHLTDAIAMGGQARTLVRRLTTLEGRRTALLESLDTTPASRPRPVVDWRVFDREARRVLAERRQALTQPRNIEDTRQILRELLAAPLRFTPMLEEGQRGYRFTSALSVAGIFGRDLAVTNVVSPGRNAVTDRQRDVPFAGHLMFSPAA